MTLTVNLSREYVKDLYNFADRNNLSIFEAISRALAIIPLVEDERKKHGFRLGLVTKDENGEYRQGVCRIKGF